TGRQLTGMTQSGTTQTFTYNDEGIRTSKTVNGVTTTYYLSGSQIIAEETSGNLTVYIYDSNGSPIGMQYHGSSYAEDVWDVFWYEKNLQGDIVAVYNDAGTKLVTYYYDAFGYCIASYDNNGSSTRAYYNPFRYRGYYYDKDLDLYYLNSRYYDGRTGRFISPDAPSYLGANGDLNSYNLYAYCSNNPVMYADPSGRFPITSLLIGIGIGALFGTIYSGMTSIAAGNRGKTFVADVLEGALTGATLGAATTLGGLVATEAIVGMAAATSFGTLILSSYVTGMANYTISQYLNEESFVLNDAGNHGTQLAVKSIFNFSIGYMYGITNSWSTLNQGVYTNMFRDFRDSGYNVVSSVIGASITYITTECKNLISRAIIRSVLNKVWDSVQNLSST
ncbi:MAG: RHS repeat-associated core domain-containing protein, partial [Ruminococcaceae bacterium]|nr:RHS repeat-associated core domain-containing protein [Oscillospiraceae bacterium]